MSFPEFIRHECHTIYLGFSSYKYKRDERRLLINEVGLIALSVLSAARLCEASKTLSLALSLTAGAFALGLHFLVEGDKARLYAKVDELSAARGLSRPIPKDVQPALQKHTQ